MDGIIIAYKEKGWTSNDVVQKVKHITKEKVGHTGTLDPLATGVLPLLIGKGTMLSKYLINHDKEYIATLKLGKKTTTGDSEGEVTEEKNVNENSLKEENIKKVLKSFVGETWQTPPIYSAIKVNGKKLYEYARNGQNVEIAKRQINIYYIELLEVNKEEKEIVYKVKCSKGTYIRSLCEDIAQKLETVGFMKELIRTNVGDFYIENAIKISEIKYITEKEVITIEQFFKNKNKITLNEKQLKMFLNGVNLQFDFEDEVYRIYDSDNIFIGSGIIKENKLKRDIVV